MYNPRKEPHPDSAESQDDPAHKLVTYRSSEEHEPSKEEEQQDSRPAQDKKSPHESGHAAGTAPQDEPNIPTSKVPPQFQVKRVQRPNFPAHVLKDLERMKKETQRGPI